jgi:MFS transporter, FHS family, glucose/mannose:H+ symporter
VVIANKDWRNKLGKKMNITNRLTWLSYLIFLLLGCAFISQGVLIICFSKTYSIDIAHVGYLFFITAAVQALTTYGNGYLLEKVNIKHEIFIGISAVLLSFACIISGWLPLFIIGLFPMGFGYGILISIPNYIILQLHPETKFQKLNFLNFFFSLGGILGPLLLGQFLDWRYPWQLAVSACFIFFLLIAFIAGKIPFSRLGTEDNDETTNETQPEKKRWHYSIYLIAAAMLFYVLSECVFSTWIVSYLKINCKFSIAEASMGLTVYWLFITFGRFAADKIAHYMKVYQFIIGSSIIAFTGYLFLFFTNNTVFTFILIAIMGAGYAALYASLLSYGMDQLPYNSPKLMSILVLAGTAGTILALPLSSFFVNHFGLLIALLIGLVFIALVIISIYLTLKDKDNRATEHTKRRHWGAISRRTKVFVLRHVWFSLEKVPITYTKD